MAEYTVGSVFFDMTADVAVPLSNIDYPTNSVVTDDGTGTLYAEEMSMTNHAPVATMTAKSIDDIMSVIGLNGQCVGSGFAVTACDVIARRLETCQVPLTGNDHIKYGCAEGLLRLATLDAPRGEDATISFTLDTFTDGTNAPVLVTDGVAMPTVTTQRFTLGQCAIAGVPFTEIDQVTLAYNVEITDKMPVLGSIWPDSAGVLTVRPTLTLTGRDLSKVKATLIDMANAGTHDDTEIWLIKRKDQGTFEDFASAVHIKITFFGLAYPDNLVSASANSRATDSIMLQAAYDAAGAKNPLIPLVGAPYAPYTPGP